MNRVLRTPQDRFDGLPDFGWEPRYVDDLDGLDGLRVAYLDEGRPRPTIRSHVCTASRPGDALSQDDPPLVICSWRGWTRSSWIIVFLSWGFP